MEITQAGDAISLGKVDAYDGFALPGLGLAEDGGQRHERADGSDETEAQRSAHERYLPFVVGTDGNAILAR